MLLRSVGMALLGLVIATQSGCCLLHKFCCWKKSCEFCGSGCGEVYWSEWHNDPPDCLDPCNRCGNYVGPQCCTDGCGCKAQSPPCDGDCGGSCSSCGGGGGFGGCSSGGCGCGGHGSAPASHGSYPSGQYTSDQVFDDGAVMQGPTGPQTYYEGRQQPRRYTGSTSRPIR
jgi:hypothetical protein